MNAQSKQYHSMSSLTGIIDHVNHEYHLIEQASNRYPRHQLLTPQLNQAQCLTEEQISALVPAATAVLYCNVRDNLLYLLNEAPAQDESTLAAQHQMIEILAQDLLFARDSLLDALGQEPAE